MEKIKTNELSGCEAVALAKVACSILLEKKALDVRLFCVEGKTSVTDYYVNCTGRSSTQVAALADYVSELIGDRGRPPLRVEGRAGNSWILVDYGDVIVNVFDRQSREFYNFDKHLPDDCEVDISDIAAEIDKKFELNKTED